jgi:hypothetical protein
VKSIAPTEMREEAFCGERIRTGGICTCIGDAERGLCDVGCGECKLKVINTKHAV